MLKNNDHLLVYLFNAAASAAQQKQHPLGQTEWWHRSVRRAWLAANWISMASEKTDSSNTSDRQADMHRETERGKTGRNGGLGWGGGKVEARTSRCVQRSQGQPRLGQTERSFAWNTDDDIVKWIKRIYTVYSVHDQPFTDRIPNRHQGPRLRLVALELIVIWQRNIQLNRHTIHVMAKYSGWSTKRKPSNFIAP